MYYNTFFPNYTCTVAQGFMIYANMCCQAHLQLNRMKGGLWNIAFYSLSLRLITPQNAQNLTLNTLRYPG